MTKEQKEARQRADVLIEEMLAENGISPEAVLGRDGLVARLTRRVVEKALAGELTHHLGYAKGGPPLEENCRNGTSVKTVLTEDGPMEMATPRDRAGTFEPLMIAKGQRRFAGFDEKIIAMYARGMSVREIQGFLLDQYKVEISPDFISTVTDAVLEEVTAWQNRPLEAMYPIVFLDALRVKIRDEGTVKNKAVYLALGVLGDGTKEVLGLWIEQNEGARFWLKVMNELKTRSGRRVGGGGGRAERISRSDHGGVSPDDGADVHCASDALEPGVLFVAGPGESGGGVKKHLPCGNGGEGAAGFTGI